MNEQIVAHLRICNTVIKQVHVDSDQTTFALQTHQYPIIATEIKTPFPSAKDVLKIYNLIFECRGERVSDTARFPEHFYFDFAGVTEK